MNTTMSLAISPDTDDWTMIWAIATECSELPNKNNLRAKIISGEISQLNQLAEFDIHDITAISMGQYAKISGSYELLNAGFSMADSRGPSIVALRSNKNSLSKEDLTSLKVAVPGLSTTACKVARFLYGISNPVPYPFTEVEEAVLTGAVDAGILIHENQLASRFDDFSPLYELTNIGKSWRQKTGLPLPLGAIAIKRSLEKKLKTAIDKWLTDSIRLGALNWKQSVPWAMRRSTPSISMDQAKEYIDMYVDSNSSYLGESGRRAVQYYFNNVEHLDTKDIWVKTANNFN